MDRNVFHSRRVDWAAIFVLALGGRFAYWFMAGTRVVGDATGALAFCDIVSPSALLGFKHTIVYSGFQLPYCAYINLTGGYVDGWVVLQILLSAVSCVLLYETGRLLVDRLAGLIAGLSFALLWEVFHWVVRPMSEPVFTIVMIVALWRLAIYEVAGSRRNRLLAAGALLYLGITRPNGLPIVAGYLLWDTLFDAEEWRLDVFSSRAVNAGFILLFGGLALYRMLEGGELIPINRLAIGEVVTGHVTYNYTPVMADSAAGFLIRNAPHVVTIVLLRGLWFFAPILPGWSVPHIVLTMSTLFPLIVGGLAGIYRTARHERRLFVLWVTPILMSVLTAMVMWVAGSRNFLGPSAACFALLTGYMLSTKLPGLAERVPAVDDPDDDRPDDQSVSPAD